MTIGFGRLDSSKIVFAWGKEIRTETIHSDRGSARRRLQVVNGCDLLCNLGDLPFLFPREAVKVIPTDPDAELRTPFEQLDVLGLAGAIGRSGSAVERISETLDPIVPLTVKEFILELLVDAGERVGDGSVALVVGSVLVAVFFGSRAVVALQKSLAAVEDRTEQRPVVQMRLVAIGLTLGGGFALILTSFMLIAGRTVIEFLAELTGADLLDEVWVWLRVPIAAAGLFVFLLGLSRLGPPEPLPRAWLAALVATSLSISRR